MRKFINTPLAGKTSNILAPTEQSTESGILFQAPIASNSLNGFLNVLSETLKETITMGGLYNPSQAYRKNDVVKIICNNNSEYQCIFFVCTAATSTGVAPIQGDRTIVNDIPVYFNTDAQNMILNNNWAYLTPATRKRKSFAVNQNMNLQILSAQGPMGFIRIQVGYSINGAVQNLVFEVHFMQGEIKIRNVKYPSAIKQWQQPGYNGYGYIFFPGIAFYKNQNSYGLYIANYYQNQNQSLQYNNGYQIQSVVVDYENLVGGPVNFIQSGLNIIAGTFYAIRDGGGDHVQNIGDVHQNMHSRSNSGFSFAWYCFQRGAIPWDTSMVLPAAYWQFNNSNMVSVNFDTSGRFAVNIGNLTANTPGVKLDEALPNIQGDFSCVSTGAEPHGAFSQQKLSNVANGGGYCWNCADTFNASNFNSVYQDGAHVRQFCFTSNYLLQAF